MMQALLGYLFNAAWQAPLAAGGALLLSRLAMLSARGRCLAFAAFLAFAVASPMAYLHPGASKPQAAAMRASGAVVATSAPAAGSPGLLEASAPIGRAAAGGLVGAVLLVIGLATVRLLANMRAARGLVRRSTPFTLAPAVAERLRRFAGRSGQSLPEVRCSHEIAGPAVVGARPAVILVPEGFDLLAETQASAALLHECAHVVRRDYALNLACEVIALPLSWHPATYVLKARFRAAREIVCDQLAAAEMGSPAGYARCLIDLARSVQQAGRPRTGTALAMLGHAGLEARVRELVRPGRGVPGETRARSVAAVVGVAVLVGAPVAILHVTPALVRAEATPAGATVRRVALVSPAMCAESRAGRTPVAKAIRIARMQPVRSLSSARHVHLAHFVAPADLSRDPVEPLAFAVADAQPVAVPARVLTPVRTEVVLQGAGRAVRFSIDLLMVRPPCSGVVRPAGEPSPDEAGRDAVQPPAAAPAVAAPPAPSEDATAAASPFAGCLKAAAIGARALGAV